MRFVKILLVCVGLVLLAGLGTNHGSAGKGGKPCFCGGWRGAVPTSPAAGLGRRRWRRAVPAYAAAGLAWPQGRRIVKLGREQGRCAASFLTRVTVEAYHWCPAISSAVSERDAQQLIWVVSNLLEVALLVRGGSR